MPSAQAKAYMIQEVQLALSRNKDLLILFGDYKTFGKEDLFMALARLLDCLVRTPVAEGLCCEAAHGPTSPTDVGACLSVATRRWSHTCAACLAATRSLGLPLSSHCCRGTRRGRRR